MKAAVGTQCIANKYWLIQHFLRNITNRASFHPKKNCNSCREIHIISDWLFPNLWRYKMCLGNIIPLLIYNFNVSKCQNTFVQIALKWGKGSSFQIATYLSYYSLNKFQHFSLFCVKTVALFLAVFSSSPLHAVCVRIISIILVKCLTCNNH